MCLQHLRLADFDESLIKPQTNDFIEYQLALARMNVREGAMSTFQYHEAEKNIREMVKRMNKANIPLDMISSVRALDAGIRQIQTEGNIKKFDLDSYFINERINPDAIFIFPSYMKESLPPRSKREKNFYKEIDTSKIRRVN